MSAQRIHVWVQRYTNRKNLVLMWIDPDTRRMKTKSAGTSDPKEAEDKRTDHESNLNNGRYQDPSRISWEEFRRRFEEEYVATRRPNTRANFEDTLDLFEELCRPDRLAKIGTRTVSVFAAAMRAPGRGRKGNGMKASTIKVRLQFLRTALRWAVKQELLSKCPEFPCIDVDEKDPQPVPLESFERILARAEGDPQMQAYLLTGWLAGLRLSEAYELEWEETDEAPYLDLPRNRIVLPASFVKGKRDQWVPLDPQLRLVLLQLPRRGKKVFHFPSGRGGGRLQTASMSDRVVRLARRAGVRLTMHTLRKGFGCRYAGKVPAQVLQKLMRHSNIKTTMRYYANVDEAVMQAVLGGSLSTSLSTPPPLGQAASQAGDTSPSQDGDSGLSHSSR